MKRNPPGSRLALSCLLAVLAGCSVSDDASGVVSAASSLRHVMPELLAAFVKKHPGGMTSIAYGGSGTLRSQVEAGAPIDVVVLAGSRPIDRLEAAGLLLPDTRRRIARNKLVLVGRPNSPPLEFASLPGLASSQRIAIGHPETTPVGAYTRALLLGLGLWDELQDRLVFGGHVASVVAYVRRAEVDAGIVYWTEAHEIDDLVVLDEARAEDDARPEVVAAVTRDVLNPERARLFVDFLGSSEAATIFAQHGFQPG